MKYSSKYNIKKYKKFQYDLTLPLISTHQLCGIYQNKAKDMSSPGQSECPKWMLNWAYPNVLYVKWSFYTTLLVP